MKPRPFHPLICMFGHILLSAVVLMILNANAYADQREVRVGVYANKPLVYQDENGEHQGLSVDVLRFVASQENWKLEFVPCSWSECLAMLKSGENDIQVIIAKTPERSQIYDFTSQSLYSLWAQIFIHPDSDIHSWTDLQGKNVAVYKDDLFSEMFKKLIGEFGIDCNLLVVENYQAMLKLIKEKKADAGVFIQTFAEPYAVRGIVRRTPIMFNPVPIYYAFPKGKAPELATAIDRHLELLKKDRDSIYYHSLEKIFTQEKEWTFPSWIKWVLLSGIGLLLFFLFTNIILNRRVRVKTAELIESKIQLETEIVEHKQAEEALKISEAKYRSYIDNAPDGVCVFDKTGKYLDVNEAMCKMWGYSREELLSKDLGFSVPPDEKQEGQEILKETLAKGYASGEAIVYRKDGSIGYSYSDSVLLSEDRILAFVKDITDRKRAEEELKESEKRYRLMIENQTDLVCRFLPDGTFVFVNDVYCQFFNKPKEELIGSKWLPLPVDDDVEIIEENLSAMSPTNPTVVIENRMFSGKGEIHWVQFINRGFFDHQGDLLEIQSVGRDVTERVKAEQELHEREENIRLLLNSTVEGIYGVDQNGICTFANPACASTLGYDDVNQLIGKNMHDLIHHTRKDGTPYPQEECKIFEAFREGTPNHVDDEVLWRADGASFQAEYRSNPIKVDGKIFGTVVTFMDITEKKKAEEDLRESEEKYRNILTSIEEGYFEVDLAGKFTFVSDSMSKIFDYSKDEFLTMSNKDFVDSENANKIYQGFNKIYRTGIPAKSIEYETLKRDGSKRYIETSASLIRDNEGNPIGFRGITRDISAQKRAETERRQFEAQLQQSQKMESIGTLAGGIAHDFNNILSSIIGFSELAVMDIPEGHPSKESLEEILIASERAKQLVQQMLSFARPTTLERRPIKLGSVVSEALGFIRATIPTTIEIRQNIETEHDHALADPTQIHQILMNLCTNAGFAMRDNGGIMEVGLTQFELSEESMTLPGLRPGKYLKLCVADTGPGMDKKTLDRIFEPFFTTKGPGEGTGMGLSVVHGIVTGHDGIVIASSEPAHGSSFEIYLPQIEMEAVEPLSSRPDSLPTGTERILFVDDEISIATLGRKILERLGYQVTSLTSSQEAMEMFTNHPDGFDLIITDMTMPHITGLDLAREVLGKYPDMPIILCTGHSERLTREGIQEFGIKRIMLKPLNNTEMATAVREVLDEKA